MFTQKRLFNFNELLSINMKGVVERSSVFASEILTAISPIPEVIHKTEITKKNNLEAFKQA